MIKTELTKDQILDYLAENKELAKATKIAMSTVAMLTPKQLKVLSGRFVQKIEFMPPKVPADNPEEDLGDIDYADEDDLERSMPDYDVDLKDNRRGTTATKWKRP